MKYICIDVEDYTCAKLLSLKKAGKHTRTVTTLEDNQTTAIVKIYLSDNENRELLSEFVIRNIQKRLAGEPKIQVTCSYDGKRTVELSAGYQGRVYRETHTLSRKQLGISMTPFYKKIGWTAAVIVMIAGLIFGGIKVAGSLFPGTQAETDKRTAAISGDTSSDKSKSTETYREKDQQGREGDSPAGKKEESKTRGNDVSSDKYTEPESGSSGQPESSNSKQAEAGIQEASAAENTEESTAKTESTSGSADTAVVSEPELPNEVIVYFEPDKAELTAQARQKLDKLLSVLKKVPNVVPDIKGHCAPQGEKSWLQELSQMRADRVYTYLRENGWNPKKEPLVKGYGIQYTVTEKIDNMHLNRRVEIELSN